MDALISETNAFPLFLTEKYTIVNMVTKVLTDFNPHRFLHLNLYNIDPVQLLADFNKTIKEEQTDFEFHDEMTKIFSVMNDFHTLYFRPRPLFASVATLFFTVERIFEDREWRYIVSDFASDIEFNQRKSSSFRVGSEILLYDGEPTDTVVKRLGEENYGSNPAAQISMGKSLLSLRVLAVDSVPVNESVSILYRNVGGAIKNIRVKWVFADNLNIGAIIGLNSQMGSFTTGVPRTRKVFKAEEFEKRHTQMEPFSRLVEVKQKLFRSTSDLEKAFKQFRVSLGSSWTLPRGESVFLHSNERHSAQWKSRKSTTSFEDNTYEEKESGFVRASIKNRTTLPTSSFYEDELSAEIIHTNQGAIGRLRLSSFSVLANSFFIEEVARVLRLMPKNGVVVDLRDNAGGEFEVMRGIAELLTDKILPPGPNTLRASKSMLSFHDGWINETFSEEFRVALNARKEAIQSALLVGETFSGPTTDLRFINFNSVQKKQPRAYQGPVVTLVSGNTYSAADLFAALQVDQNLSVLVGIDENTGAGGASVVPYSWLEDFAPSEFERLPFGVRMSTAFSRFYRTGTSSGKIVEFFGVKPQIIYNLTRADALREDSDLYEFLGNVLREERRRRLIEAIVSE